jgi:hypothetical protein
MLKLTIELVPSSSWFNNVRSAVSAKEWDKIRKQVYSEAWHICQICGGVGPNHPVEAHEIWEYDDKKSIQKLTGMIALCQHCHMVKHMGFATVSGKRAVAVNQFIDVNNLKRDKAEELIKEAFELWNKRSKKKWTVDLSYLKKYNIDLIKLESKNDGRFRQQE